MCVCVYVVCVVCAFGVVFGLCVLCDVLCESVVCVCLVCDACVWYVCV